MFRSFLGCFVTVQKPIALKMNKRSQSHTNFINRLKKLTQNIKFGHHKTVALLVINFSFFSCFSAQFNKSNALLSFLGGRGQPTRGVTMIFRSFFFHFFFVLDNINTPVVTTKGFGVIG